VIDLVACDLNAFPRAAVVPDQPGRSAFIRGAILFRKLLDREFGRGRPICDESIDFACAEAARRACLFSLMLTAHLLAHAAYHR
jgi:hypothetical protein